MPSQPSKATVRRFQCRHIFTGGHRCGSPCLRHEDFCYYHHTTRRPTPAASSHDPFLSPPNETSFFLPHPEDRRAIQHSIGEIINKLACNALDPRRAGLILYALQIASGNLKTDSKKQKAPTDDETVEEIIMDPVLGPLAPAGEVGENEPKNILRVMIERFEREDEEARAAAAALSLNAAADSHLPSPPPSLTASTGLTPASDVLCRKVPPGGYPARHRAAGIGTLRSGHLAKGLPHGPHPPPSLPERALHRLLHPGKQARHARRARPCPLRAQPKL